MLNFFNKVLVFLPLFLLFIFSEFLYKWFEYISFKVAIKEGFLLKQTWSFQRWRRRYFRLKRNKLYYAKEPKVGINL